MGGDNDAIGMAEAASALRWWLDAGVDGAVQEAPRDWLKAGGAASEPQVDRPPSPTEPLPETLDLFRDWLGTATSLPLGNASARRVLPHGAEGAPVMLIAEMPAREDAAAGRPIGGEAWALTEKMLAAIGIAADEAYCANLACFHAPGSKLGAADLEACAAIARRHIALAKPQRLLLLGDAPARALLGKPMTAARGHAHKVEGVRAVVTFHPRQLLTRPSDKALAWRDLLLLMEDEA